MRTEKLVPQEKNNGLHNIEMRVERNGFKTSMARDFETLESML